ncbi:IS21 family transposase, partial [Neobacillus cucumis]|nr:IS21 family transposase [Neobacillus cucumis]
ASHSISPDKGQLIRNTSHQRDRSKGLKELMEVVGSHFTNSEMTQMYFQELRKRYPRYLRDQLSIIKKCIDVSSVEVLDDSLALCMERQHFSANDFQDVV